VLGQVKQSSLLLVSISDEEIMYISSALTLWQNKLDRLTLVNCSLVSRLEPTYLAYCQ